MKLLQSVQAFLGLNKSMTERELEDQFFEDLKTNDQLSDSELIQFDSVVSEKPLSEYTIDDMSYELSDFANETLTESEKKAFNDLINAQAPISPKVLKRNSIDFSEKGYTVKSKSASSLMKLKRKV